MVNKATPQQEYTAKRVSVQLTLRAYYNECVAVMAQEEGQEITMEDALNAFNELDAKYAKLIVDDISPLKNIIEL